MSVVTRTKKGYGDFGNLSKTYDNARKGFPTEAVDYIFEKIGREKPYMLDIGCGTGIATEQLLERGAEIIGTDVDAEMIRQAEADNRYRIEYQIAPAEKQPFSNSMFDAVTAFSAFHWFANKAALDEIKRVLKHNGWFFSVNKNEAGDFKKRNKEILQQFIKKKLPDIKKEYKPREILLSNSFSEVKERTFPVIEYFSPKEALDYVQTMSVWNLVPDTKKRLALEKLSGHFNRVMKNGKVERQLNIVVVSGKTG